MNARMFAVVAVVAVTSPDAERRPLAADDRGAAAGVAWGRIDAADEPLGRVVVVVQDWPADGRLPLPRTFPQVVRATCCGSEPRDVPIEISEDGAVYLALRPGPAPAAKDARLVAVEIADETRQFDDGRIVLTARDARVTGTRAKLESHPGNHRIGFWVDRDDVVAWTWKATRWGRYDARLTFSTAAPPGTEIEVAIGDTKLAATLPSTDSWYRYATLPLGPVSQPKAGDVPVTVRCTKLVGGAVMNLKAITLEPACEGTPPEQAADGTVTLHGQDATVLGTVLRYEPAEAKQTLGFWTRPTDAAAWTFGVTAAGAFDVEILQGCGTGQGGSEMAVVLDPASGGAATSLRFTVEDTGGFQQFRPLVIGRLELTAGRHTLLFAPRRIAKAAACDIRQVRLVPVKP